MKKLIIFGITDAAQMALYYFSKHTSYNVECFTVDAEFIREDIFCGLPVVPFENIIDRYPSDKYDFFIALGYSKLNKIRKQKYELIKKLGYNLASYISPYATVLNDYNFGNNCFILENNTIQPFVQIGNNVTLWSGNHIGHHSIIHDHCFLASHIVVSGRVEIGESCFIGVNATFRDNIIIGENTIVGAGTLILSSADSEGLYIGTATKRSEAKSAAVSNI